MSGYRILYHHRIRADDGQAVHVRELIGALRRAGHDVLECALVTKADAEGPGRGPAPAVAAPAGAAAKPGLWQRLSLPRWGTELLEIAYDLHGVRALLAAARSFQPHFIYERHALHCASGLKAARRLGVPLLLEVNSPMGDEMRRLGLLRFAGRARATERRALAGADGVLAVTEVLRQRLIECGAPPPRCHVISNGAEPDRYGATARDAAVRLRAEFPADAFLLGFVGYVRDWHRIDLALEAMARPELRRVHLVMLGAGPALPDIVARAAALRLGDRLHTMGVVPADQLPAHLCAFDAALIPAINEYASPLKLFDSLAAGVVTLAPDQPNLRERIVDGETGLLFERGSVDSLAAKLGEVVADPARATAIGAAGQRALVERDWTWAGNAKRVIAHFEELRR
ncbi:MAG: glycosyltransferase family 4 protein [Planctomycetota bacterium]